MAGQEGNTAMGSKRTRHFSMENTSEVDIDDDKANKKTDRHLSLQEIRNGIRKTSHALGLKAASLAATVNAFRSKPDMHSSMESLSNVKINQMAQGQGVTLARAARDGLLEVLKEHLQSPTCNVNEADEDGLTALHHTARYNRLKCVKILYKAGADINAKGGSEEVTPLHLACRYNSADVTQFLVASGADLNATDYKGKTPLHYATRRGNNTVAKMLLAVASCNVDAADSDRTTPLHMACMQGSSDIVEPLVSRGARVGARDINDMTPLMWAAAEGHCDVMKILLLRSVKQTWSERQFIRAQDNEGNSALHIAVMNGKYKAASMLIEHLADVNCQKANLQTPLHIAATQGFISIVALLIRCGAKVDLADAERRTAVHMAALCNRVDVLQELMNHGADLNASDNKNMSPLHCACWKGQTEAVEFLLHNGAQVAERDSNLMTVLHWAVQHGHYDTLTLLLKNSGCNLIEATDKNDQTVLHYASKLGNVLILKTLLDHGAFCGAKDVEERTPLHIAAECDNAQCVEALIEVSKHETNDDDADGRTPVLLASMMGHHHVVELLLLLGADITCRDDEQRSALMLAAEAGHSATMNILLGNHAVVNDADKLKNTALHYACAGGYVGAVCMLLQAKADVTMKNARNQTPLDMAIDNMHCEVAIVMLQHDSWRQTLSVRDSNGYTAFDRLIARLPDAAMVVLDHCVERSTRDDEDANLTLTFDYHFVDPGPDDPSTKSKRYLALNTMIQYSRDSLLSHLVCQNILRQKWVGFGRSVFYMNLFLFIIYMVLLTWYTWEVGDFAVRSEFDHIHYCPVFNDTNINMTMYNEYKQTGTPTHLLKIKNGQIKLLAGLLLIFNMMFLAREAFKFFQRDWRYLLHPYTWINISQPIFMFMFIHPFGYYPCIDQWHAGWKTNFLAWINFIIYLRKFDFIGIYVIMFEAVFFSLLRAILIYFFFCWAFAGSFYILLVQRNPEFRKLDETFLNIFIMTLGEVNKVNTYVYPPEKTDPFRLDIKILITIFIFLMTIVLVNLMIGVAVGDIDKIRANAYLKRTALQVELLYNIENTMPAFLQRRIYKRRQIIKPNESLKRSCSTVLSSIMEYVMGTSSPGPTHFIPQEKQDKVSTTVDILERELALQSKSIKALQNTADKQTVLLKQIIEKLNIGGASDSRSMLNNPELLSSFDNAGIGIQSHRPSYRR